MQESAQLSQQEDIDKSIAEAHEAADFLRQFVVQAELNERGNFGKQLEATFSPYGQLSNFVRTVCYYNLMLPRSDSMYRSSFEFLLLLPKYCANLATGLHSELSSTAWDILQQNILYSDLQRCKLSPTMVKALLKKLPCGQAVKGHSRF